MTWTEHDSEKARHPDLLTLAACRKLLVRSDAEIERIRSRLNVVIWMLEQSPDIQKNEGFVDLLGDIL